MQSKQIEYWCEPPVPPAVMIRMIGQCEDGKRNKVLVHQHASCAHIEFCLKHIERRLSK